MKAEILCVGTEILLGDIVNTNASYISKRLAALGVEVYNHTVVGDNPNRLKSALKIAFDRADTVIMTGGLGPTYDDLTKETVAEYFNLEMFEDEKSLNEITAYFKRTGREMTENNRKQALFPQGAVIFPNENGTAPGFAVQKDGKTAVLLPGPPIEMMPMFKNSVEPYFLSMTDETLVSQNIHIFGMGESTVETKLRPLMLESTNPTIAPYAKRGEVRLRVTAKAHDYNSAHSLCEPMVQKICDMLGDVVYGVDIDSLQNAVVHALKENKLHLASAESCTGGMISSRITDISGASSVFSCGVCAYSNEIKEKVLGVSHDTLDKFGAVSDKTALEMARGVRKISGAQIGISTTGVAGPDTDEGKPVGLVYVGIDSPWYSDVLELHLSRGRRDERDDIRYMASSHALNLVLNAIKKYKGIN